MARWKCLVLSIAAITALTAGVAEARRAHGSAQKHSYKPPASNYSNTDNSQALHFAPWTITDNKGKVVGTWTWDAAKQGFSAKWTNGIEDSLHLDVFSGTKVELSGTDHEGAAVHFVGDRHGNAAEGSSITESVSGSSTWQWKASWSDSPSSATSQKSPSPASSGTAQHSASGSSSTSKAPSKAAATATTAATTSRSSAFAALNNEASTSQATLSGTATVNTAAAPSVTTTSPSASTTSTGTATAITGTTATVAATTSAGSATTTSTGTATASTSTTAGTSTTANAPTTSNTGAATSGASGTTGNTAKKGSGKRFSALKTLGNMLIDTLATAGSDVSNPGGASSSGGVNDGAAGSGQPGALAIASAVIGNGGGGSIPSTGSSGPGGFVVRNQELNNELQSAQSAEKAGNYYEAAHDWWYSIDLAVGGRGYKERKEFMETGEVAPGLLVRDVYRHSLRCHVIMYRHYLDSGYQKGSMLGEHVYSGMPEEDFTKDLTCLQYSDPDNPAWFYLGAVNWAGGTNNPLKYVHAYWELGCALTCKQISPSLKQKIDVLREHIRLGATLELADLDRAKYENMIAQIHNQENPTITIYKDQDGKVLHVLDSSEGMYRIYLPMMKEMVKNDYPKFVGKFDRLVKYVRSLPNNAVAVPPGAGNDEVFDYVIRQVEEKAFGPVDYKIRNFI
jgi:hypothetical protein